MLRFACILVVMVCSVLSIAAPPGNTSGNEAMPRLERFSPDQVDKSADPCDDFFQYACGKWIKANPIPPDQPAWGTFNSLAIWNLAALRNTLEQASNAAANRTPVEQKAGDYYASCMDEAAINKAGIAPVRPLIERIANLRDKSQMAQLVASIHQTIRPANLNFISAQYPGVLFGIYASPDFDDATKQLATLDQSGMGMPSREFYLKEDEKSKQIRDVYSKHVARVLELSGENAAQATADSQVVLKFETALANAAMDIIERRDPKNLNNKMSLQQLQTLTPSFNWKAYFAAMKVPDSREYLNVAPGFFRGMEKLLSGESIENWRTYLRYSTINFVASLLSQPLVEENFAFYGKTISGSQEIQPRWRRCSAYADIDLGEVVGQAYVNRYFPPQNKTRMLVMVKAIGNALHEDIDAQSWMSAETKKLAHEKLRAQVDKIGYPDHWLDYSSLAVKRDDFFGNTQRASAFEINRRISKVGKPTDRHEWGMTPPTVNAYEDPQTNTINFPAGILQPPFFDAAQIDAANYGAIGAVIGHEIIHGYDDQGRKFDADGNLRDWWTAADATGYEKRDDCIAEQYTQDVPEAGVKQNGKLSLGEDTADNGGVHLTLNALQDTLKSEGKSLDTPAEGGMTQAQTFFTAYATVWCGELRPEAARTAVLTQGHSLNRYRTNNVLANMPEFAHAFGCKSGQKMVRANACRVW